MEKQKTKNSQRALKKKNKSGELTLPDFKAYYKDTVNKTVQYWCQNRQIYKQVRIENPEIDPRIHGQFIFNRGAKTI